MCTAEKTGMIQSKKIYALTGGIGCGKTAVSAIIRECGYPVFSCDEIYSQILKDKNFVSTLERQFGGVTLADGSLDRATLSAKVFSDINSLKKLNAIAHPAIMDELFRRVRESSSNIVFCEVPLLFENGYEKLFDGVIVVMRPESARIKAVMERSGLTEEQVKARMAAQFDYSTIATDGYMVICNDDGLEKLSAQVKKILKEIT